MLLSLRNNTPPTPTYFLLFPNMKPIPTDTSDFADIRNKKKLYVDKTALLNKLITDSNKSFYFISRPRRFGKSLMISTLKAIFQGKRELFDGLAIAKTDYDWKVFPVIHLNLGFCARETYEQFTEAFPLEIQRALHECNAEYNGDLAPASNLGRAIDAFYEQGQAPVILIDEYDDPVAKAMAHIEVAEKIRADLSALYGQLKDRAGKLRFVMVTGISKFTKMSVFSAMSNLNDISYCDDYADMLGFTENELDKYYSEHMEAHAKKMRLSNEAYRAELKRMYNGYRFWSEQGEKVYNPVSINLTLANQDSRFKCYWSDTGRPSMLMNFLKRENVLAIDPERVPSASQSDFDVIDFRNISVKGLLFQTGYLTITDYNLDTGFYTLGIPDAEVRQDFARVMASLCANKDTAWAAGIGAALLCQEWDAFFSGLKSLYAGVAYGSHEQRVCEHSFGRCLAFLLQGQGIICQPEVQQARNRADMVCTHKVGIFIFELKVDKPAKVAMSQAKRKEYALPFAADQRPIWLIGLSFSSETRQLVEWTKEQYR